MGEKVVMVFDMSSDEESFDVVAPLGILSDIEIGAVVECQWGAMVKDGVVESITPKPGFVEVRVRVSGRFRPSGRMF